MKRSKSVDKVRCKCGDEILMLPGLQEMGKAIEDHVEMHLQGLKGLSCSVLEAEDLRKDLIIQVLTIAADLKKKKSRGRNKGI